MATDTFKRLMFGLVVFGLFAYLVLSFIVELGGIYGKSASEIGDGALDEDVFIESIANVSSSASGFRQSFEEGDVDDVDDARGIFSILNDMVILIINPFTLLGIVMEWLSIPTIFIDIAQGLLAISIILGIWSLVRKGD